MDGTIVATALPSIVRDVGGVTSITWIVTAYLLAQIATMPLYGKLGDVYGRKSVFLVAIGVFTVGSMLCGLAQSLDQLLVARTLQGIGAGGLGPLAMAILGDLVPPRQLGRWLGYQGAIFAVGGVAGPLAGGLFVDYLSWRWAFFFNVPLALSAMGIVWTNLQVPYRRVPHRSTTRAPRCSPARSSRWCCSRPREAGRSRGRHPNRPRCCRRSSCSPRCSCAANVRRPSPSSRSGSSRTQSCAS